MRVLVMLAVAMGVCVPAAAEQQQGGGSGDRAAIEATIRTYFEGDINRDPSLLEKAFHPDAKLLNVAKDGRLGVLTQPDWHASISTPDAKKRERPTPTILDIDIAGNAAIAKTQLVFTYGSFTDYLSLLKLDGTWTIVNKIYYWEDAPK